MLAQITDSQGKFKINLYWKVITKDRGLISDCFIDDNQNIYFEREHHEFIDAITLINLIQDKVKTIYNLSDIKIALGRVKNT
ncbi:hypothetical protein GM3708_2067 [Geminocystis sp. NIES-3708]|uniref:hypothetical protein n=1 Tax=Geminocystis sp. NIES-3708 TaxID=1615909 RepID=UPI0005FC4E16|nr:hypothetical protein [Geminocystis sp. NIES-3708]BAQ61661.1 hypothetical protein GM3708_2067 [Geminocystis sp. NIES-3708]